MNDAELLAEYVGNNSEDAFRELVRLHIGMVFAVCKRQLGNQHWAQDVTQAVFVLLARKAKELPERVVLGGWLYRAAMYACSNARQLQKTRTYHENLVTPMKMSPETDPVEQAEMEKLLDEGLLNLSKAQRDVLVLRFFEDRPLVEIARMRKQSLYATQKALDAGLARLRRYLRERGAAVTAGVIVAALSAQAARAVPVGLAGSVGSAALGGAQSPYVAQLVTHLVRHAGRAKLLGGGGALALASTLMLATLVLWFCVYPHGSGSAADRPGTAASRMLAGSGAPAAQQRPDALWAGWQRAELWATLRKADHALRQMDVPAIGDVLAFTDEQQKANWDEMLPVLVQNHNLQQVGVKRFGAQGESLAAIKTFGERIDEILPQVDAASVQWSVGKERAALQFGYREAAAPGGTIFFVREQGRWKIDVGRSFDLALEGLNQQALRVAFQELDPPAQVQVRAKMNLMAQAMTEVAGRIQTQDAYSVAEARRALEAADARSKARAFLWLTLRVDDSGQIRN